MSAHPTLRLITPIDTLYPQELDLRHRTLRAPLGLPPGSERFPFENESLHLVAVFQGRVVGCVLFHPEDGESGRLLQMAVEGSHRGDGLGSRMVQALEREVRDRGFTRVHLHARAAVAPFYRRLGYVERGAPFEELGVLHVEMWRAIDVDVDTGIDLDGAEDGR